MSYAYILTGIVTSIAFVIALMCAVICQWAIGCSIFRQIEFRRGLAKAVTVMLLCLLGCDSSVPVDIKTEQKALKTTRPNVFLRARLKALQTKRPAELREIWKAVMVQYMELEALGLPTPESLADFADAPEFQSGNLPLSDIGFLPEYLVKLEIHGVIDNNLLKDEYPLRWLDSKQDADVLVVLAGGSGLFIPRTELETLLNDVVNELSEKLAGNNMPENQPAEDVR